MQLARLALHYPKPNLTEQEYQLLREDMIRDLLPYHPGRIADACEAWRKTDTHHFPTSGQLLALIRQALHEVYVRAEPVYRAALPAPDAKFPKQLRSWREIVKGPVNPTLAAALDQLQG